MTRRWLHLTLAAPLMSFGDTLVDHVGPTLSFPGRSMLTGLIANALGYDWTDRARLGALQARLINASALAEEGDRLTDVQNAKIEKTDRGWTTRGAPEGRDGASYHGPHRRYRDYLVDAVVVTVLTLEPSEEEPTLDAVAAALDRPARPLFLGRKTCLPTRPLLADPPFLTAATAHAALQTALAQPGVERGARAWWPEGEGPRGTRALDITDLRHADSGLHGGSRRVEEGRL